MIAPALALLQLLSLPQVDAVRRDDHGCARIELRRGGRVTELAVAPGLCVRDAFTARLEPDGVNVVLLVDLPRAPERLAPFVYRLRGTRLVPRFLSSGFATLRLERARRITTAPLDQLGLDARDENGGRRRLRCSFQQFPLVCVPE